MNNKEYGKTEEHAIGEHLNPYLKPESCGDGGCVIAPTFGIHTNGGCRCYLDDKTKLRRALAWYRWEYEHPNQEPLLAHIAEPEKDQAALVDALGETLELLVMLEPTPGEVIGNRIKEIDKLHARFYKSQKHTTHPVGRPNTEPEQRELDLAQALRAITSDWTETNRRRCELIRRDVKGPPLSEGEREELARLEMLADARSDVMDIVDAHTRGLRQERDALAAKLGEASLAQEPPLPMSCETNMRACQECAGSVAIASLMGHRFVCSKCGRVPSGGLGDEPPPDLTATGRDRPMRVYVAGGSSERMLVQGWIDELVRQGVAVTYDWTRDPGWSLGRTPTNEGLAEAAARDLAGIDSADLVWRIIPLKLSEGSADEGGYARGCGKRIVVSGAIGSRNVFELLPSVMRFATHEEAAAHIVRLSKDERKAQQ